LLNRFAARIRRFVVPPLLFETFQFLIGISERSLSKAGAKVLLFFELTKYLSKKMQKKCKKACFLSILQSETHILVVQNTKKGGKTPPFS